MKKYFYLKSLPEEELLKELLKNPPMHDFYVNMYVTYAQERQYIKIKELLIETISKFD
jgi:hypothetical protein